MDENTHPPLTVCDLLDILAGLPGHLQVTHLAHRDDAEESGLTAARVPIRNVMIIGSAAEGEFGYVRLEGIDSDYPAEF
jgi:hypothetical protein